MNLTKGTHTCTLSLAPDFDNTNVKSLYFCDLLVGYAGEAAAVEAVAETEAPETETEAPETEAPETEAETAAETEAETTAPETEAETETVVEPAEAAEETVTTEVTTAPQTFDVAVIAGIAAVVSLAGFAASTKH